MIDLSLATPLGGNQSRDTFAHPTRPDLVLKVQRRVVPGRARWYERPPIIQSSTVRELSGYAEILIGLGRHHSFIARIHGLEATTLGPAVLCENAVYGCSSHAVLRKFLKGAEEADFTSADISWARERYVEISDLFCEHRVYSHGLRLENFMLVRQDGNLALRMFDFKTVVYRQLISPRFVPGGRLAVQKLVIGEQMQSFDRWLGANA